ncbi:TIGR02680 family protein [Fonticella tunisiensis]|uniref:Uncharacterized protein (TIGR02680 family) n=1 Tax=Fonticella tunisiensis TaxID=1096341 RepID=A0A4R7KLG5_9CLOT|nr:TIGR02680 family protein [Fonticella tunisiensis]TDT57246.1 uncharacterized protein (TIGR02680 family) [Fonticella tunisiensis]
MSNRWIINRAGLINFWYYDDEEFSFSDGRLLLRGSNGSGKSVTMQSFIPLLLDGNKSPERLDPFGSKARRLENYLLDEDEERDENTAYLYMEFKKEKSENYLTIGMGFKAQRGKPLQSWGFSITDGRRVGKDFYLYKDVGDKLPLSKKELENRIAGGGRITETQGDYMKMVNDLLFGFDDIEEYDELIKLLVQLRTPKLSKDFKPTVVYEIMENSLQPLSEDDLRPMSEAIENMDNIKSRLEELKESQKAAEKIMDAYDRYNRFILVDKAKSYINASREYEGLLKDKRALEEKRDNAKEEYEDASRKVDDLKIRRAAAEQKKKQLEVHDSIKIRERLLEVGKNIEELESERAEKLKQLDGKKSRERQLYHEIKGHRERENIQIQSIKERLDEMDGLAGEFAFDEQSFMKDEITRSIDKRYDFSYIKNAFKKHVKCIEDGRSAILERERKNSEYDRALQELEGAKAEREMKLKRVDEVRLLLSETKEELIEKVYTWRKGNRELLISDDGLVSISRAINNFNYSSSYDEITSIVRDEYSIYEDGFNREISRLGFDLENLEKKRDEIENEIKEWKNKRDPEPERSEKVMLNRKRLDEEGIPYIPLYRAVDFREDLSDEVKGRIEEALMDMGLLDALIVPSSFKSRVLETDSDMADKYIFPSPGFLMHDLSELLRPEKIDVEGITAVDIDNVLKSILIDEESSRTYINEKGEYGIGILKGKTSKTYVPRFIGASARKRFREEMIESLTRELEDIKMQIRAIEDEKERVLVRLGALREELNAFPKDMDLKVALNELRDAEFNLRKSEEEVLKREREEKRIYDELKELNQRVYDFTHKINLRSSLEVYDAAVEAAGEYRELLYELDNLHQELVRNIENVKRLEDEKENVEIDIENLSFDINIRDRKLKEAENLKSSLEDQLKLSNYEEVKKEIEECLKLINELPGLIEREIDRRAKGENLYRASVDELHSLNERIALKERILEIYRDAFIEEYNLRFLNLPEIEDPLKGAWFVIREIKLPDKNQREDYVNKLYERFTENTQYLREYILKMENIFEKDTEGELPEIAEALSKGKRLSITGKIRGRDVDFYKLLDFIKEGIEENEGLLKESDRQLFEDILVKNISKKIRAKIYHSEQWVKKMNELMETMNTSSGLSFSLRWTSKRAESEGQLDTKELVELLKQEGSLMKESDLNKLSEHFRSKISEARRIQEDTGKSQSFHSIMREILDYRKWFEFKLFFIKTGQPRKELTNNAFFQFSGGEKAMTMYVPLFSAVYARYEGARKDCPRLISLDEAFAGVDEKNIRDMFRLLNELNLDFIINSQILWGDYDTVPSLSISELIRPDNAKFVTVIRYHWNGRVKELVV